MNRNARQNDYSAFLALLFYFKTLVNFMTVKLTKLEMNISYVFFYTDTSFLKFIVWLPIIIQEIL